MIRNPFVWLWRIRHRCGYGIHSPFAYQLTTQVIYSPGVYYADEWLDALLPWYVRLFHLRVRARLRLFFRLANHFQPKTIAAPALGQLGRNLVHRGCVRATLFADVPEGKVDMLLLNRDLQDDVFAHVHDCSVVVIDRLQRNKPLWQRLMQHGQVRVTFDLYDVGIAIFDPKLQKQNYIINW